MQPYIGDVNPAEPPDPLLLIPESHRRLTVEVYHRMIEAEVLGPDDKVELLEGVLVELTPQSPLHARVIRVLNGLLVRGAGPGFEVGVQVPLTVSATSEPEPDLFIIPAGSADTGHPRTALLVVEVSRSSSKRDRILKAFLYARAAIPEYWIVDVEGEELEVLTQPDPADGKYKSSVRYSREATVSAGSVPGISVPVGKLFPR